MFDYICSNCKSVLIHLSEPQYTNCPIYCSNCNFMYEDKETKKYFKEITLSEYYL